MLLEAILVAATQHIDFIFCHVAAVIAAVQLQLLIRVFTLRLRLLLLLNLKSQIRKAICIDLRKRFRWTLIILLFAEFGMLSARRRRRRNLTRKHIVALF